jgi:mono/diheme cytochrome c family protein
MRLAVLLLTGFCSASGACDAADPVKIDPAKLPPAASGVMEFARDIEPIFVKNCYACHGPQKQRGGLRLDDGAAALKGGNSGPEIVAGRPAESRLLIAVSRLDAELVMPPKEKTPLTREEIGRLRAWIEQGAIWPRQSGAASRAATSNHWAFQPIRRSAPPTKGALKEWLKNDIDQFVLARLENEKLAPSPPADLITLIRRLTFDLIGLPPAAADIDQFLRDCGLSFADATDQSRIATQKSKIDAAYLRLVDRLLSSPHYGERWGRHWLDLARYADSDGYEADRPRPYHWRYRDWVIEAINRDLPFDQFTIEQLAGDLLPNATLEQKTGTGFHRNTLTNREGGTDKEQFRVEACVDRVNTTAKVWLGLTLGCAQCHDHKYDPFSQREYYQFFAFFNPDDETDVPAPLPGDAEALAAFQKRKADLEAQLAAKLSEWEKGLASAAETKLPAAVAKIIQVPTAKRSDKQRQALAEHVGKSDAAAAKLSKALADHLKKAPTPAFVPTLAAGDRKTHVLIRGDFLRPGIAVESGTPSVLPPFKSDGKRNRLDLARWLVAADNPLTARVTANWVWHHYFGRGLVATLEDFGTQGEKPSHPELLDHLAAKFMEMNWSMKALHRYIVTSATYRQSSKARPELASRDPLNILLARQTRQRLEAEIVRDNALAVSGLLMRKVGGPSVKPPQPAGISELTYANSAKWVESKGEDRYRRGMYTWFQRTSPYPMLTMFDAPDGVLCAVRRERTNTPLQALTLLNDATFVECAQALAQRIMTAGSGSTSEGLDLGFRSCFARPPTPSEQEQLQNMYDEVLALCRANPKEAARLAGPTGNGSVETAAWTAVARMLMNLDEFVTRE